MPFESKAQRRFMYAKHPEIAERWQKHTPKDKKLPERKKESEVRLGTAFTDGFLKFCLDQGLTGDQVADMLEKGAEQNSRTGSECRGLLDRIAELQE